MQPSHELEKTFKVSQAEIREAGGLAAAAKGFDLKLDGGNGGVVGRWGRDGRCVHPLPCPPHERAPGLLRVWQSQR